MVNGPIIGLNSPGLYLPPNSCNTDQLLLHCIIGHFARQCSSLSTSALISLSPAPALAPRLTFTVPYAHIVVHYPNFSNSSYWIVDSVIPDLASLALHEPYTASDNIIIGDDTCLSIANFGSFTIPSLPTPFLFTNVLHVPVMSKNLISVSALCVDNLVNVLFFYSFLRCRIVTQGHYGSWAV